MIAPGADLKIYIATRPIDFRCGHDGWLRRYRRCFVSTRLAARPSCSDRNERTGSSFWSGIEPAWYSCTSASKGCNFVWPTIADGVMRVSPAMFAALFEGLDWRLVRPEEVRRPAAE